MNLWPPDWMVVLGTSSMPTIVDTYVENNYYVLSVFAGSWDSCEIKFGFPIDFGKR